MKKEFVMSLSQSYRQVLLCKKIEKTLILK